MYISFNKLKILSRCQAAMLVFSDQNIINVVEEKIIASIHKHINGINANSNLS